MKDAFARSVGSRLTRTARLHRALSARLLSDLGLFPGQETVLARLRDSGGMTMGELAAALKVRPPTASKTVARLAAQGLVERRAGAGDGRLVQVALTDSGRARASAIAGVWETLEGALVAGLDGKERKRLRKLLRKVEESLAARLGTVGADDDETDADDDDI